MAGDLPEGLEQFRVDDPNWWPEDRVTIALREAERDRVPRRPLLDDDSMERFVALSEKRCAERQVK